MGARSQAVPFPNRKEIQTAEGRLDALELAFRRASGTVGVSQAPAWNFGSKVLSIKLDMEWYG